MLDRLHRWNVGVFFADYWEAYVELIPQNLLIQTKAETPWVESDNFR
jgi:IS1 family transposase